MKKRRPTLNINEDLYLAIQSRMADLGFPGINDYVLSLVRFDILTAKPHRLTGEWAKLSHAEQDKVDMRTADAFLHGEVRDGKYLQDVVRAVIKEMQSTGGQISEEEVLKKAAKKVR